MAYYGKITSFEAEVAAGTITSHSSGHAVMFLAGDLKNEGIPGRELIGKSVSFEMVQTAKGAMAVNVRVDRRSALRPGDRLATLVTPILAFGIGYYFYHYLFLTPILSYLAAVNLVGFILLICHSSRGYSRKVTPSEILLAVMAIGGAAVAIFFASSLVPCKWRSDAGRFSLFAMVVIHLIAIHTYAPGLLSRDFKAHIYRHSVELYNGETAVVTSAR